MKRFIFSAFAAGLLLLDSGCSMTPVSSRIPGYLTTPGGRLLLSEDGQCWRTAEWRPDLAIPRCDPEVVRAREEQKKKVVEKKKEDKKDDDKDEKKSDEKVEQPVQEVVTVQPADAAPSPDTIVALQIADTVKPDKAATTENGKPAATKTEVLFAPLVLNSDASFRFNDYHLTPDGRDAVGEMAGLIKARHAQDLKIVVEGYTDRVGSKAANLELSRRRAAAVKAALVDAGIPAAAVQAVGLGSAKPVTQPDECPGYLVKCELIDCLRPDRRVEIKVRGKVENGTRTVPVDGALKAPWPRHLSGDARRELMRAVCKAG